MGTFSHKITPVLLPVRTNIMVKLKLKRVNPALVGACNALTLCIVLHVMLGFYSIQPMLVLILANHQLSIPQGCMQIYKRCIVKIVILIVSIVCIKAHYAHSVLQVCTCINHNAYHLVLLGHTLRAVQIFVNRVYIHVKLVQTPRAIAHLAFKDICT